MTNEDYKKISKMVSYLISQEHRCHSEDITQYVAMEIFRQNVKPCKVIIRNKIIDYLRIYVWKKKAYLPSLQLVDDGTIDSTSKNMFKKYEENDTILNFNIPSRFREILHYLSLGFTQGEISDFFEVSESRISQLMENLKFLIMAKKHLHEVLEIIGVSEEELQWLTDNYQN